MSKRSVRKFRHRSDVTPNLTFKQSVQIGMVHAMLLRKEITYNDVPQWMKDLGQTAKQEAELNAAVQFDINSAIITDRVNSVRAGTAVELPLEEVIEHVHGEHCNH